MSIFPKILTYKNWTKEETEKKPEHIQKWCFQIAEFPAIQSLQAKDI